MRVKGIASDSGRDAQGEFLDPSGMDLSQLRWLNWNHLGKSDPSTIIGEPDRTKCKITPQNELYIEGTLYPELDSAKATYALMKALRNSPSGNRLSLSVEGKVTQRGSNDPKNPAYNKIVKSKITAIALCPTPINSSTWVDLIKGEIHNDGEEMYDDDTLRAIREANMPSTMKKSDIFDAIFKQYPGIEIEKAKSVYELIQKVTKMSKDTRTVSDETIKKSFEILGLASEEISKGEGDNTTENVDAEKPKNLKRVKDGSTPQDREKLNVEKADKEKEEDEREEKDMTEKAAGHAKKMKKAGCTAEEMGAKLLKKGYGYKVVEKALMKAEAEGSEEEATAAEEENKESYDNEAEENSAGEEKAKKTNAKNVAEGASARDKEKLNVTKSFETLADLIKSQNDSFNKKFQAIGEIMHAQSVENQELKKSLESTLQANEELKESVETALAQPNQRKSIITKSFSEKFEKSEDGQPVFNIKNKADRKALSARLMDLSGIEKSLDGFTGVNKQYTKIAQDLELSAGIEAKDMDAIRKLGIKVVVA